MSKIIANKERYTKGLHNLLKELRAMPEKSHETFAKSPPLKKNHIKNIPVIPINSV